MVSRKRKRRRNGAAMCSAALMLVGLAVVIASFVMQDMAVDSDTAQYAQENAQLKRTEETFTAATQQPILLPVEPPSEAIPITAPVVQENAPPSVENVTGADLQACVQTNPDFIAWMTIPNTSVDLPIVSSDDTEYYLHHTFAGKRSYLGCLFSLKKTDYEAPSRNIAVYGHHLRSNDEAMFSPLLQYKDPNFYAGHELIHLDTLHFSGIYRIFAAINMRVDEWDASTADFENDAAFAAFVSRAQAQALYPTGVTVEASDQILTLITCDRSYGGATGRLIVMAVKE